ncbi:hypothetical protein DAEQUDRAFT_736992 [Daedalea quercina L-15889]|uniref:Aminoglycoside phosphotransferase domain-containing protein n=1 Tax=Daedalea quercina L-15889 TaxID=1314783 RepID=A0A165RV81_9APHY|nr:hypothetical protein DAEQUDRAFT_736992 [Daedalea quercina L-15889]
MRFSVTLVSFVFLFCTVLVWAAPVLILYSPYDYDGSLLPSRSLDIRGTGHSRQSGQYVLKLNGQKILVQPNSAQGAHGVVYRVVDGHYAGAFAKALVSEQEIAATKAAGALLVDGSDDHKQRWAVIRASPGKRLDQTSAYHRVHADRTQCNALLDHAADVATREIMAVHSRTRWLHQDPSIDNILFDDGVAHAYLIDWGCTSQPSRVDERQVRAHVRSALAQSGICPKGPRDVNVAPFHCPAPVTLKYPPKPA